ncbi:MAG: phosphonopyruvate decarboxylase [Clostridia bacterium]|nr:phosphonopyruvate decarboxylase [Clostridia bacterium]
MINQAHFLAALGAEGVEFFTGVPDSYLNGFCNHLLENVPGSRHIIAANEGNAIAIAAGYYFSTNTVPLVYMQNSGMGNTLNPLMSLADKNVYSVPLILLIGWRGEPSTGDWPQHETQGIVTTKLLDMLDIPYVIAPDDDAELASQVRWAVAKAKSDKCAVAIIGRKGVFASEKKANIKDDKYPLCREDAIEAALNALPKDTIYSATTGRATRELYFLRERRGEGHDCDFLNVGSMGHASSVALGIAVANKHRNVVCLDGDAAAIMHMGAFAMASKVDVPNFIHIVLNNGAHESVGGQPSVGQMIDFTQIAKGTGYATASSFVSTREEISAALKELSGKGKAAFLDIRVHKGLNGTLPPLKISHSELIGGLMGELSCKSDF